MIRVMVVDDHTAMRAGLIALINLEKDMSVVGQASNGEDAISLYRKLLPDVTTIDIKMPGIGGGAAISSLRSEFPTAKILVLTSLDCDEHIHRALQAGALGYLLKDADSDEFITAIRSTHSGKQTIPDEIAHLLAARLSFGELSARELQVLRCVARGRSNKEIAADLALSENTVKDHLKAIAFKLNTPDRTSAAILAVKRGLIALDDVSL